MRITEGQLRRIIKEELLREAPGDVILYRAINGDLIVTPQLAVGEGALKTALGKALKTGDRASGEALLKLIRANAGQYFADSMGGIEAYAQSIISRGGQPTVYKVVVPESIAIEASFRASASSATAIGPGGVAGTASNYVLTPSELFTLSQRGAVTVASGPGKVVTAASDAALSTVMRRLTSQALLSSIRSGLWAGVKGLLNPYALVANFLGMASAPFIYAAVTGVSLEQAQKDIDTGSAAVWGFVKGLLPGGDSPVTAAHKEAYNTWAEQQKESGKSPMSWDALQDLLGSD